MYIEITQNSKKYYLDTKEEKFNQEVIDDLEIEDVDDICDQVEWDLDSSEFDHGEIEVEVWGDNELRATYTDTKLFSLIEALEDILGDVVVKEITKEFYDSAIKNESIYKCEHTLDLFENKE